jgi:hypothetical protein
MNQGFYKRRRGILEHLEGGKISLLDLAVHDYLNLKANLVVGNGSSVPPGVCITSAAQIHTTCPRQISERAIQRSIEHLCEIGWIKTWRTPGQSGKYPILIARSSVADLSGNEYRVNAVATTNWRSPVLESVGDSAQGCPKPVTPILIGGRKEKLEEPLEFVKFYQEYPRKVGRSEALKAWKKLKPLEVPLVLAGLDRWKQSEQWFSDNGRYIPHPATFLNKRRWEDDHAGTRTSEVEIEDIPLAESYR